jgi:nicotinamidase-related amidase
MRELGADTLVIAGVTSANCAHATAIDGWNMNYKVIVLADTTTAVPSSREDQPLGYGQHWEALRNIQMNYGDVITVAEFLERVQSSDREPAGATA